MEKTGHYYKGVNTSILKVLPENMRHVIELGCAEGRLGAAYKHENPGCTWRGVDIHESAVEAAKQRIDFADCADANKLLTSGEIWRDQYDCLVMGDVLEHLVDPATSLPQHLSLLKPSAHVVICIPNIQHWSTLLNLVRGKWEYRKEGLMDNTHLRFFTRDSACRLLESMGVQVDLVKPVIPRVGAALIEDWGQYDQFLPQLLALQREYGGIEDIDAFRAYQYVISGKVS